ncbi:MAG: zinc-binding dehydrogenase [Methylococcaceae bacterium]
MKRAQAIYHQAIRSVAVGETDVPMPRSGELLIKTRYSAISSSHECRLFRGEVAANASSGRLLYPLKSGHALVGEVIDTGSRQDGDWIGKQVFAYHPHQSYVVLEPKDCVRIPAQTPLERALFLASMESALTILADIEPALGERVMVFGLDIVGLLITALLGQHPLAELITADPATLLREKSLELGAGLAIDPQDQRALAALRDCLFHGGSDGLDVVVDLSGRMNALNQAIQLAGTSARVVIASRYGQGSEPFNLDDTLLDKRIRLISSVSRPHTSRCGGGRWNRERRVQQAWDWLARVQPEQLISHRYALAACQEAFDVLGNRPSQTAMQVIFRYE